MSKYITINDIINELQKVPEHLRNVDAYIAAESNYDFAYGVHVDFSEDSDNAVIKFE